jgi:hypothetical protein
LKRKAEYKSWKGEISMASVHFFGDEDGSIYAVIPSGDLLWYKDLARDGTANWANGGTGQVIGNGWDFSHVFSGGDGIIDAVQPSGDLLWYKDLGRDGKANWANLGQGVKIGEGWTFE